MTPPVKNANGFTLLELILSMAIVGFIVAISLGAIRLGISTQEVGRQKTETYQRLRIIGEHLSQKIKSSYPKLVPPPKILSLSTGSTVGASKQLLAFEGKKNSIRFVTFASPIASTDNSVWAHEVRFYQGEHPKSGKKGIIMMEKDISPGNIFTKNPSSRTKERYYLLAEDVAYLNFRYYITKKISPEEPGLQKDAPAYEGKWVDQILFNPPISSKTGYASGKDKPLPDDSVLTLPKGVEFSLGLLEPAAKGSDKKPKLISSPPVLLLLHSGMEFSLPLEKNDDEEENNAPS
jgi:prepilin-type N-terminal cleavage/methylation domain-containing protein